MKTNKDEDRCEITGLKRISCYHCQAPPEYEMKKTIYSGTVEILHKGNSITESDKNFMFGKSKARLFLACIDIVEEFAATQGEEQPDIRNQEFADAVSGDRIFARVESFFDLPDGRRINAPWIRLESGNNPEVYIGFGRQKAKAIVAVRRQLAEWANYPLG